MNSEILVIILTLSISFLLIYLNFDLSIFILLLLSVLLHKELFSIYMWDLMPVRLFMLAMLSANIFRLFKWFFINRDLKKLLGYVKDPFIFSLVLLWVIRGLSIIFSKNINSSLFMFGFFTTIVGLGLALLVRLRDKSGDVFKYIKAYIFVVFALCAFGYVQLFLYLKYEIIIGALWNVPGNLPRIGSTFWDVNHFGALLAVLLPVLAVLVILPLAHLNKRDLILKFLKYRLIYIFMALPMVGILLLTNSRTAWMAAFVSFISFISIMFIRKFGSRGILIVVSALVIISIPLLMEYSVKSSPFRAVVKQYFHYRMDSFDSHFLLLTGAFQIFERYPVLGGGFGSFFEHFSKMPVAPTYFARDPAALNTRVPPHTIWGELVAETGYLGLLAFLMVLSVVLGSLLYIALKYKDVKHVLLSSAMASGLLGWMIAGIFYSYNSEFFWIIIFLYFVYAVKTLGQDYNLANLVDYYIRKTNLPVVFLGVIAFCLIFINLGTNHLIPWDEAIYAKIAKNMVTTGDYISQQWFVGKNWYEKPPLYMWFMAGCMKILGFTELAARLPSALLGFGTVFLVYLLGKKLFNKIAGFVAGFALITTFQFLYYARAAMLDVSTTFFITLAFYLYLKAKDQNKLIYWITAGLAIGCASLIKGVVGFLPIFILFIYEFYLSKNLFKVFSKRFIAMIVSAICVFLPWHAAMYQLYGLPFIQNYIVYHVFDRAVVAIEDKGRPIYWYLVVLKVSLRTWFVILLGALPLFIYKIWFQNKLISKFKIKVTYRLKVLLQVFESDKFQTKNYVFLLVWFLTILVLFSLAKSKLVWYIMPAYPAICLMVGVFISKILNLANLISFSKSLLIKSALLILLVAFQLFYMFLNKNLIYTSDLTGSQAQLLQLKDTKYDADTFVFVDKIEEPLVLFYTDGPYETVDYSALTTKIAFRDYTQNMFFITKESRLNGFAKTYPGIVLKEQIKEWVLGYAQSRFELDQLRQKELLELLEDLNKDLVSKDLTAKEVIEIRQKVMQINAELSDLENRIKAELSKVKI